MIDKHNIIQKLKESNYFFKEYAHKEIFTLE